MNHAKKRLNEKPAEANTETAHTPGPWKHMGIYSIVAHIPPTDDNPLGQPSIVEIAHLADRAELLANAALIAAAPETAAERDKLKTINQYLLELLAARTEVPTTSQGTVSRVGPPVP